MPVESIVSVPGRVLLRTQDRQTIVLAMRDFACECDTLFREDCSCPAGITCSEAFGAVTSRWSWTTQACLRVCVCVYFSCSGFCMPEMAGCDLLDKPSKRPLKARAVSVAWFILGEDVVFS